MNSVMKSMSFIGSSIEILEGVIKANKKIKNQKINPKSITLLLLRFTQLY